MPPARRGPADVVTGSNAPGSRPVKGVVGEHSRVRQVAAGPLGEELGLGERRMLVMPRRHGRIIVFGGLVPVIVAGAGIPAVAATSSLARVVCAAVFGGLAVAGMLVLAVGGWRSARSPRLCVYSGGIVQFTSDEPEPRVLRWDDMETVTLSYADGDRARPRLDGCVLRARGGTVLSSFGIYRTWVRRWLVTEAGRVLAPRLVPPLIATYESGEPVSVGDVRVDQSGIIVGPVSASRVAWADMGSVTIRYETSDPAATSVSGIEIRPRSGDTRTLSLAGIPNGILLPHLVAHAAARNGVPVLRYPRRLGDGFAAITMSPTDTAEPPPPAETRT